jgi:hypothetical protein
MAWTCLYKSIDQASCNESYGTKKTDQQKKRISEWQTGKPLSAERKKNISKALSKVYFENGTEKIMTVVDMAKRMNKSVSWIYYKISKGDKIGDFFIRH